VPAETSKSRAETTSAPLKINPRGVFDTHKLRLPANRIFDRFEIERDAVTDPRSAIAAGQKKFKRDETRLLNGGERRSQNFEWKPAEFAQSNVLERPALFFISALVHEHSDSATA
jgi:hypothetical protein